MINGKIRLQKFTDEELQELYEGKLFQEIVRRKKERYDKMFKHPIGTCLIKDEGNGCYVIVRINGLTSEEYQCTETFVNEDQIEEYDDTTYDFQTLADTVSYKVFPSEKYEVIREKLDNYNHIVAMQHQKTYIEINEILSKQ